MANELVNYQDHGSSERGLVDIEQGRAIQEVQAAVLMARRFPRDVDVSRNRILTACQRKALAESAMYEYPRGGIKVTGPSIRLAEVAPGVGKYRFWDQGIEPAQWRIGDRNLLLGFGNQYPSNENL